MKKKKKDNKYTLWAMMLFAWSLVAVVIYYIVFYTKAVLPGNSGVASVVSSNQGGSTGGTSTGGTTGGMPTGQSGGQSGNNLPRPNDPFDNPFNNRPTSNSDNATDIDINHDDIILTRPGNTGGGRPIGLNPNGEFLGGGSMGVSRRLR